MIWTTLSVICEIIIQLIITDKLVSKKRRFPTLFVFAYVIFCFTILFGIEYCHIKPAWSLMNYVFFLIYMKTAYKIEWREIIFIFLTLSFIVFGVELVLLLSITILTQHFFIEYEAEFMVSLITLGAGTILSKKLKREWIQALLQSSNFQTKILSILCTVILLYILVSYKAFHFLDFKDYILLIIFMISVTLLIVLWQKERYIRLKQEQELKVCMLYENAFGDLIAKIQSKQHEFDNHLSVLKSQIFICQSYEELKMVQEVYMNELNKDKTEFYKLLKLKSSILAGLLYIKFCKAKELEISISYDVLADRIAIALPMPKITEVISVLLDNAIEKLENMEKKDRHLIVFLNEAEEFIIEVWNRSEYISKPILQKFFEKGYTTKSKGEGFGLYNLKNIVEGNQGSIIIMNKEYQEENYIYICIKLK